MMENLNDFDLINISWVTKEECIFEVYGIRNVPFEKIKIMNEFRGNFIGYPNVRYVDSSDYYYGISGSEIDVASALQDTLKNFVNTIPINVLCTEENFEWSDYETF